MERRSRSVVALASLAMAAAGGCGSLEPEDALVFKGAQVFFFETFEGNGRTCGSCHPNENNYMIDPAWIATLDDDDPLFVHEFNPALRDLERAEMLRKFGLILENQDGFEDLEGDFNLRGVPHLLGLNHTIASADGPQTGWSGDGSPGDGSLRSFAVGAIIQHMPKTLDRIAGVDFRLPTELELDALEAFMLTLGRQEELILPLPLRGEVAARGQDIFLDDSLGKCNICHINAGGNALFMGQDLGNANFDTGVEALPDQPARLTGQFVPPDDGRGTPGDGAFNTPSIIEAADTGPFFHNNSVETLEGAVAFYNGDAFNNSPVGRILAENDPNGIGIKLDATQVVAVSSFLRVINALQNMRESVGFLQDSLQSSPPRIFPRFIVLQRAMDETTDAIQVLERGGLHPEAVIHLREALEQTDKACHSLLFRAGHTEKAIDAHMMARAVLINTGGRFR